MNSVTAIYQKPTSANSGTHTECARGGKTALVVFSCILMIAGFVVLQFVRRNIMAQERALQSAAMQYARVRNLYAEHPPR